MNTMFGWPAQWFNFFFCATFMFNETNQLVFLISGWICVGPQICFIRLSLHADEVTCYY